MRFKKKLKRYRGDYMDFIAKIKPDGNDDIVKKEEIPYMGCYIQSIDQLGKVVLKFNVTLVPELVYADDLKKVIKFEITPEDDGRDDMDEIASQYKFDWKVINFDKAESIIEF